MEHDTPEAQTLDDDLRIRISRKSLKTFKSKSLAITGKDYQVFLREMINAFNDGRLRLDLTEEQKKHMGDLYNVNKN